MTHAMRRARLRRMRAVRMITVWVVAPVALWVMIFCAALALGRV